MIIPLVRRLSTCLLLSLACAAQAFDTSRIHDPDVKACIDRSLPTRTARQVQQLDAVGKDGFVRSSVREMFWKRSEDNSSRVLLRIEQPEDERGVAVLVNDDASRNKAAYVAYSPKIKRVRRVTGESVFGTIITSDFTYDDFSYFYRRDEREQVERRDDAVLDDAAVYLLETTKPRENSDYSLVRFFIDQKLCVPVRTEFVATNGGLRKELVADRSEIREVDGRWVPHKVTMTDHKLGTKSIYTVLELDIDPDLDDNLFEQNALLRGGH